jgi:hypothetical protein
MDYIDYIKRKPTNFSIMTALTTLFPTPTVDKEDLMRLAMVEKGTDEYGQTKFHICMNYVLHGMQHFMAAQAQEVVMTEGEVDWNDILVHPVEAYKYAVGLLFGIDEDAAEGFIEGAETIFPIITDQLKKNPMTLTSENGEYVAIHLNKVADAMAA